MQSHCRAQRCYICTDYAAIQSFQDILDPPPSQQGRAPVPMLLKTSSREQVLACCWKISSGSSARWASSCWLRYGSVAHCGRSCTSSGSSSLSSSLPLLRAIRTTSVTLRSVLVTIRQAGRHNRLHRCPAQDHGSHISHHQYIISQYQPGPLNPKP